MATLYTGIQSEEDKDEFRSFARNFREQEPGMEWFVAELDGKLISSQMVKSRESVFEHGRYTLYSLVTMPEFRGKGVTAELTRFAIEWIREQGGRILLTSTRDSNQPAQRFFEKVGFIKYGTLPRALPVEKDGVIVDWEDEPLYCFLIE